MEKSRTNHQSTKYSDPKSFVKQPRFDTLNIDSTGKVHGSTYGRVDRIH